MSGEFEFGSVDSIYSVGEVPAGINNLVANFNASLKTKGAEQEPGQIAQSLPRLPGLANSHSIA